MKTALLLGVLAMASCQRPTDDEVRTACRMCGIENKPGSGPFYDCLWTWVRTDETDCLEWYGGMCTIWAREPPP